jgi:hypothetical protein
VSVSHLGAKTHLTGYQPAAGSSVEAAGEPDDNRLPFSAITRARRSWISRIFSGRRIAMSSPDVVVSPWAKSISAVGN